MFRGEEEKTQKCVSQVMGLGVVQDLGHQNDRFLLTAGYMSQESAFIMGTQVILTIRRIWVSRATGQLHASELG